MRLNTEIFKKRVQDVVGDEYSVLGEYVDYNHTKIMMRHNICGYEYDILPGVFLKGIRCAKCGGTLKYTTETYTKEVKELVGNEYSVLGEYKAIMIYQQQILKYWRNGITRKMRYFQQL